MAVIVCGRTRGSVSSCISQSVHLHPPLPPHVCRCPNSKDPRSPRAGTGGPPPGSTYTTPDGTVITRAGGNIPDELLGEISNNVGTLSMANTGAYRDRGRAVQVQHGKCGTLRRTAILRRCHSCSHPALSKETLFDCFPLHRATCTPSGHGHVH